MFNREFKPENNINLVETSFFPEIKTKRYSISHFINAIKSRFIYLTSQKRFTKRYPAIAKKQLKAREGGGLSGEYQWVRLLELDNLINKYDIETVCEFGSGGSTTFFANKLKRENFYSLEESKKWHKRTQELLGEKSKETHLICAERKVITWDSEPATRYELPDDFYCKQFDMIYIDGPTAIPLSPDEKKLAIIDQSAAKTMPNIDVELFFKSGAYPKYIFVDGRRATVRRLCQKYNDKYACFLRYFYDDLKEVGPFLYHTVFVRRDILDEMK